MKSFAIILLSLSLLSCGSGCEMSEGYNDACYGGDFSKSLAGKSPAYSAVLDLEQPHWGKLRSVLKEFSISHELKFFDTGKNTDGLKMFSISLCSQLGIYIHADKRIWSIGDTPKHSPLPLMINVTVYKNENTWTHISKELHDLLLKHWEEELDIEHSWDSSYRNSLL
jgi:hypothetical protein